MEDLFDWVETPSAPMQGPPMPNCRTIAESGTLRLLSFQTGWTGKLVVEDVTTGAKARLAHLVTWEEFNTGEGQALTDCQSETVAAWAETFKREGAQ